MGNKLTLYKERVRQGAWDDVIEGAWERYQAAGRESLADAWTDELTDRILKRYEDKIKAMFRRADVPFEEGETINKEWLCTRLTDTLGVEVSDITPETIKNAVDKAMAQRLSEALGMTITTVMDVEQIKIDISAGVVEALESGRAADLIYDGTLMAARKYATWKRNQTEGLNKPAIQNQIAQKKYRRTHKLVWQ